MWPAGAQSLKLVNCDLRLTRGQPERENLRLTSRSGAARRNAFAGAMAASGSTASWCLRPGQTKHRPTIDRPGRSARRKPAVDGRGIENAPSRLWIDPGRGAAASFGPPSMSTAARRSIVLKPLILFDFTLDVLAARTARICRRGAPAADDGSGRAAWRQRRVLPASIRIGGARFSRRSGLARR